MNWLLLRQESAPYLATLLLGACGVGLVHLINRLTEAPTVEYCIQWDGSCPRNVTVTIQNLSHSELFHDLTFNLGSRKDSTGRGSFTCPSLVGKPPAFEHARPPKLLDDDSQIEFYLLDLQPRNVFTLTATYSGSDTPPLRLLPASIVGAPDEESTEVHLVECSWMTFFMKHEVLFLVLFSLVALTIIVFLLYLKSYVEKREGRV